jgi:uncharacterized protein (DUF1800 family)
MRNITQGSAMSISIFRFFSAALLAAILAAPPLQAQTLAPGQQAAHVLNRLAFGPRPGDIERVAQMGVQRYIDSQLDPGALPYPAELSERLALLETVNRSAGESLAEFIEVRRDVRQEEEGAKQRRRLAVERMRSQAQEARLLRAVESPRQLEEVLVDFWYNHFNVFAGKGLDQALVASYERDAIRPYVLGSFRAMLGATAKHPAMLFYLDNHLSKAGGLNENYARELMELHTLGVDGGYTQKDVTELARMLTGWTFEPRRLVRLGESFRFDPRRHDAGVKTWLGRQVAPAGQNEGEMALDVLAAHPATARHLSYKLAQYFVRDDPPPALVARLALAWRDTGGDIRQVLRVLFASPEFMAPANAGAKFKTPYRFVISAVRASGMPLASTAPLAGALNQLGMPLYGCQTPDGYKNTQAAWLNPDALGRRVVFATMVGSGRLAAAAAARANSASAAPPARAAAAGERTPMGRVAPSAPYPMMADTPTAARMAAATPMPASAALDAGRLQATLDGTVSARTREIVARSPEQLRAAMLLGSPDFMQH